MRALIVDDEPLARTAIRNMLRHHPDIEIAGECEGGAEAVTAIPRLAPDLVFLDVEMPEVDGFGVLEALGISRPHVVFVTAYHQYAVRAFEVHALDYLLKPFDRERFDPTLDRARRHASQPPANRLEHSIVRQAGRAFFLSPADVDWIEAQGNYVILHAAGRAHLFRESLAALETRLAPMRFRRIHRSTIVNLDSVRELRPRVHGDYEVVLRDNTVLKLSYRYRANLGKNALGAL